ncbi:MAG TPA: GNAT family N-acetyltransferase [Planctomycetota bacterium]|nr:GNAT family N-acetyltransferase [Planctomycetota bacterium]
MSDPFPVEVGLKDGTRVLIRRLTEHDGPALWAFFERQPMELRRLAWDDVTNRDLVESWAAEVNYETTLPLVAVDGTRIVADATLHYRDRGPLRLVGRVRWFVDSEYRGRGLGKSLAQQLINVARENGLRYLSCMLATRHEARDIEILEERGFVATHFPGYGADPDGAPEDMTYLVCKL